MTRAIRSGMAGNNVVANLRIKELTRFFRWRYRRGLPDDDAGRADAQIMADHLSHWPNGHVRFIHFGEVAAPSWFNAEEFFQMYEAAAKAPREWKAADLGKALNLTFEERTELCIRTIAAADVTEEQLADLRRERKRKAEARRRARKRGREAKIRPARSGPFTDRQQSLMDVLTRSEWLSTKNLLDAAVALPCWRDRIGQPLSRASLRRLVNREMDGLVALGAVVEGDKEPTKYGNDTRVFRLRLTMIHREATQKLSRDTGTRDDGEAA